MTRRSRSATIALASFALIASACGGDDGDGGAQATNAPPASTPVDATDAAPVATEAPIGTEAAPATPQPTDAPIETTPPTEAPEELTASDTGITADTITLAVAVADLEAVRARGVSIPETLTTAHLFDRWNAFADKINADGGINGRQLKFAQVTWDPLDQASFDSLCAAATIDNEYLAMLNGTGLSGIAMQCVVDAGMPILYGDVVAKALLDSGLVVTLAPPTEVVAAAGVKAWVAAATAPAGSTVGVLASNSPTISAAGQAAAKELEAAGFKVELIETNAVGNTPEATQEEATASVGTFLAKGAVHVLVATPFTENGGFWTAAAGKLPFTLLDTASSQCSAFGLSRAPAGAIGGSCVTASDFGTTLDGKLRPDTEFEAECRAFNDASFTEYYGGGSNPGVPAGQKITDLDDKTLISDYPPLECTIMNIVQSALANAGANPTRESFIEAALNLGDIPIANASNGQGTLRPDKAYAANFVHTITVTEAAADKTKADAVGLYNGCAAPVICGVPTSDWSPIE